MKTPLFLFALLLVFLYSCTDSTEFYVSQSGNDSYPGTKSKPFVSFQRAKEAVSEVLKDGSGNMEVKVYFREGTYHFDQAVIIKGGEFGSGNNRVIFSAFMDEKPVFSSGIALDNWKKLTSNPEYLPESAKDKIWVTNIPGQGSGKPARFLCSDSIPLVNAISESVFSVEPDGMNKIRDDFFGANYDYPEKFNYFHYPGNLIRAWDNLSDIEVVVRTHYGWVINILPLKEVDVEKKIGYTKIPGTYYLFHLTGGDNANPNLQVQNAIEYLDRPGEWIFNSIEGKIYYWPPEGVPETVYYPLLQELIRIEGNEKDGNIMRNIIFKGITFTHGDRDTWDEDAIGLQHDWAIYDESDALIRFIDTEGCIVDDCKFTNSGGGGVRFDFYSQKNKVVNCEFKNLGGVAVLFDGYGPGLKDVNKNNEIINNVIHDCGEIYLHSPGIFIWQSGSNRIAHNLIYNISYTGVVISGPRPQFFCKKMGNRREITGTVNHDEIGGIADNDWVSSSGHINEWDQLFPFLFSGNNIIEYNEIYDVMQKFDDGNAIYLSGTGYNNIVRNNYVHDNISPHRQAAIRADDYAKDITFTENIIYRFARSGIVTKYTADITNNYIIDYIPTEMVNGAKHPMMSFITIAAWGPVKGCNVKRNICYQSAGISEPFFKFTVANNLVSTLSEFPTITSCTIDSNLYFATGVHYSNLLQLSEQNSQGIDSNSVVADPCFLGLEDAGFKLNSNSPAFKLGIKQIDFEKIGLLKNKIKP